MDVDFASTYYIQNSGERDTRISINDGYQRKHQIFDVEKWIFLRHFLEITVQFDLITSGHEIIFYTCYLNTLQKIKERTVKIAYQLFSLCVVLYNTLQENCRNKNS